MDGYVCPAEEMASLFLEKEDRTEWPTEEIERVGPQNVDTLNLNGNSLKEVPGEQLARLWRLELLYMTYNELSTLPPELGRLSALTQLELEGNLLTSLPPEVGELTALRGLDVSCNRLETLPPEVGRLSALERLILSFNRLTAVPPEVGRLPALHVLSVHDNPLTDMPASARPKDINDLDTTLDYLRSLAPPAAATPPLR